MTVVVETVGATTYVGRFDTEDDAGLHLVNVGIHVAAAADDGTRDEYVRRSARFGVRADRKHLVVPRAEVARVTPLGEVD